MLIDECVKLKYQYLQRDNLASAVRPVALQMQVHHLLLYNLNASSQKHTAHQCEEDEVLEAGVEVCFLI